MAKRNKKDVLDTNIVLPVDGGRLGTVVIRDVVDTFTKDCMLTATNEVGFEVDCEQTDKYDNTDAMCAVCNEMLDKIQEEDYDAYNDMITRRYSEWLKSNIANGMDGAMLKNLHLLLTAYATDHTETDFEEKVVKGVASIVKDTIKSVW